jgi:hypothetical protein
VTVSRAAARPTADWRPMAFGTLDVKHVRNPICEPLWAGRRSIIEVDRDGVDIRDETGTVQEGHADLRVAIAAATMAIEVVVDGYLLPAPLRSTVGAESTPGSESVLSAGQMSRQMFLGGGGRNERREALERAEARRIVIRNDEATAFVAVDLLWLDGETLVDVPLMERKRLLESALADAELVRRTVAVRPPVEAWYAQWKALGFEEIAVKDANSHYVPGGVSKHWATATIPRR